MPTAGNKIYPSDISGSYALSPSIIYTGALTFPYLTLKKDRVSGYSAAIGGTLILSKPPGANSKYGDCTVEVNGTDWYWYCAFRSLLKVSLSNGYITFYGSRQNLDYAERRKCNIDIPGTCVRDTEDGIMIGTTARLQPGAHIISDTYCTILGEKGTPIAIKGRVLARPFQLREKYKIGDCVCSAPNGTVDIMTKQEIKTYPERIIGTVCNIPTEERLDNIDVNNRIWIKVR